MPQRAFTKAFSLVELSIVLVILGLLVGGVLTGQSLIRAAELRSVTTEFQQYQTAVQTFRDRFFALPGDMRNATNFWGESASGTTCATTAAVGTATCNGNGDGFVVSTGTSHEAFRFWQQLANAGLIEGTYTGISTNTGNRFGTDEANAPRSRLGNNSVWFVWTWGPFSGNSGLFDNDYVNIMEIGGIITGLEPTNAIMTPEEAWNLDTKVDDGMPATGSLLVRVRANCTDATSAAADSDNFDAEYNLASSDVSCNLLFNRTF